ncbi:electron transport complex subunit RsxB [Sodalis-like symbiont of Philaenus spumarius]|nr:electron transport complex subunit RsxB [Sodalis-like symbiont of Philaenus spumarius]OZI15092.1 electron transport complex subunit RsxB [Sodalis-like symbiont of Philaenus spumarius]
MLTFWTAVAALSALALVAGAVLGFATHRFQVEVEPVAERIDALLPQSQCAQCGYPGCRPYAEAVAGGAPINQCVPGGEAVMLKIAAQLSVDPQPMEGEAACRPESRVAWIDEGNCIGCTKCIQACPVDAIVGATRAVHTVVTDLCTGCDLCVAPCPTNCIEMRPLAITPASWKWDLRTLPVTVIQQEKHV